MEVLRSGSTGMDAGRAAMGHGWPVAACPRSRTAAKAVRWGEDLLVPFGSFCTDRIHGGHMCGDMVDTLCPVVRFAHVERS